MLSYWEKTSLLNYDLIVVGSGIVGLSTALSFKENQPAKRVLVLERAILPTGASTKNAGFACIGSLTEILDDLSYMSKDEVLNLVELRLKGLQLLRKRLGDKAIGYAEEGSYELISDKEVTCLEKIDEVNALLQPILKATAFSRCDEKVKDFGFSTGYTKHLVSNNLEGQLDSGQMMRTLIDRCIAAGIEIKTGCEVERLEESSTAVDVIVNHGHLGQAVTFTAPRVAVCTNAFTAKLYPELDIQPGRGQVLVTKPIPGLKFTGIFHFDKGYYYFRRLYDRVLFGGGRNLDFEGERSTVFAQNEKIQADLIHKLSTIILPGQTFEIQDWWTGIMAFGKTKFPILKKYSSRVFMAVRMGGMGVAIGSEAGEQLAKLMAEEG
ncbi:MAG: FAD-dependent oxidoreductase [Chitinophagales bacterium]